MGSGRSHKDVFLEGNWDPSITTVEPTFLLLSLPYSSGSPCKIMLNTQHPPCPSCPLAPHWHPSSLCVSHITHYRTSQQLRYSPTPLMDCIAPSVQKVNTSQLLHPVNSIITSIINSIILGESAWATSPNILFVFPAFPVHSEFYIISTGPLYVSVFPIRTKGRNWILFFYSSPAMNRKLFHTGGHQ